MPRVLLTCFGILMCLSVAMGVSWASSPKQRVRPLAQEESAARFYHKRWAVVIGISQYARLPFLNYGVKDAQVVQAELQKQQFDVIYLADQQATKKKITALLETELPAKVAADDQVLIFFSGYGGTEGRDPADQMGYLAPVDTDPADYTTAISMQWIKEVSARLPAKHVYYAINACYSGLQAFGKRSLSVPGVKDYLQEVAAKPAIQIVTAGRQGDPALTQGAHSVFTSYFLRALHGEADLCQSDAETGRPYKDGVVTAEELGRFLQDNIAAFSETRQIPQYANLIGEGEVVFAYKPTPIPCPEPELEKSRPSKERNNSE